MLSNTWAVRRNRWSMSSSPTNSASKGEASTWGNKRKSAMGWRSSWTLGTQKTLTIPSVVSSQSAFDSTIDLNPNELEARNSSPTWPNCLPLTPEYSRSLCEVILKMEWARAEVLLQRDEGIKYVDPYGRSVLHTAIAQKAPTSLIRTLVREKGLDPTLRDMSFRRTPIHVAVFADAPAEVFQILLDEGRISGNQRDKFGLNPLVYIGTRNLNYTSVSTLLRLGNNGNEREVMNTLIRRDCAADLIVVFLKNGIVPSRSNVSSAMAAKSANGDRVAWLLIKIPMMVTLCTIMTVRRMRDPHRKDVLPMELMEELMFMLFGSSCPRYRA